MRRHLGRWILCSLIVASPLAAARVSVSDFQVQSANPAYKFLGKGFAEFVTIELSKSDAVELIEREKRIEALREIELSQTGLVEEKAQIEAGRLLTAEYIVFGSIYDINNQLSITLRVVETSTTKVILQDRVSGRLAQYDALTARITSRVLTKLNITIPAVVKAKEESSSEKAENIALKFSSAVDAVDRNETEEARKSLNEARELDPENEAVKVYLSKLVVNTAKFRTISQEYFPNTNPASLGLARHDRFFMTAAIVNLEETPTVLPGQGKQIVEQDLRFNAGYQRPLGKKWGVGFEGIFFHYKDEVSPVQKDVAVPGQNSYVSTNPDNFGGIASLSYAPSGNISFGIGTALYQQVKRVSTSGINGESVVIYRESQLGLSFGMIAKNTSGTVMFDTLFGYSTQSTFLVNATAMTIGSSIAAPIYNENTLTFGLFGKRVFLALKEINEWWRDRNYYSARVLPVLEFWLWHGFGLRAGAAHNYANLDGLVFNRTGYIVGLSLRGISSGWDFDINLTNHNRPSRIVDGLVINESIVYFTLSKSNNFVSR